MPTREAPGEPPVGEGVEVAKREPPKARRVTGDASAMHAVVQAGARLGSQKQAQGIPLAAIKAMAEGRGGSQGWADRIAKPGVNSLTGGPGA